MLGDTHIYANHVDKTLQYIRNVNNLVTQDSNYEYSIDKVARMDNFEPEMLRIHDYNVTPVIKFDLNV